jgi:hypothetical protein
MVCAVAGVELAALDGVGTGEEEAASAADPSSGGSGGMLAAIVGAGRAVSDDGAASARRVILAMASPPMHNAKAPAATSTTVFLLLADAAAGDCSVEWVDVISVDRDGGLLDAAAGTRGGLDGAASVLAISIAVCGSVRVGAVACGGRRLEGGAVGSADTRAASTLWDGPSPNVARHASRKASRISAADAHRSAFS